MIEWPRANHPACRALRRRRSEEVAEPYGSLNSLEPGVELIVKRRGYRHHGVYVGEGQVIQYAGWFRHARGLVEEVSLEQFANGRAYRIGWRPTDVESAAQVVRRARSRLGEQRYDLLLNNCEHFCNWCHGAQTRSHQVDTLNGVEYAFGKLLQSLQSRRGNRARIPSRYPAMA
jgi:Lecithin retinol acyltransferase